MMTNNEDYNPDIITLSDDDGNEYSFEILDQIESENDKRYVALLPVFETPDQLVEDSGELVVMRMYEEDDETYYANIEDDDEYDTVADVFIGRLQDLFEIEEE